MRKCFRVVNCFQILYIRSLNTIFTVFESNTSSCELLSDFVYSFFEHNFQFVSKNTYQLWIAFRFCIFVLWTQLAVSCFARPLCCELLSDFVYSFFEHNGTIYLRYTGVVVNCFQILYIRSLNTIYNRFGISTRCCELLSDFVY